MRGGVGWCGPWVRPGIAVMWASLASAIPPSESTPAASGAAAPAPLSRPSGPFTAANA